MKKSTEELWNILKNTQDIDSYMEEQQENLTTQSAAEYLERLLSEKSLSKSDCIRKSGLDRTYCYQIFSGAKTPSRDKLLALCFAMELSVDEVQLFFRQTGYPLLYPRNERDSIILFSLNRKLSLVDTNELLFEKGLPLIQ